MMGRKFSFEVNRRTHAAPSVLFDLETDGARWSEWAKPVVVQSSWARTGFPAPGGIGAVRKVGMWPLFMHEQTVDYEQDRRHAYTLISPWTPAADYHGELTLTPDGRGGTHVTWRGWFTEAIPGTGPLMRALLHGAIRAISARLVRAAERGRVRT